MSQPASVHKATDSSWLECRVAEDELARPCRFWLGELKDPLERHAHGTGRIPDTVIEEIVGEAGRAEAFARLWPGPDEFVN